MHRSGVSRRGNADACLDLSRHCDPLARNDGIGCLKFESETCAKAVLSPISPAFAWQNPALGRVSRSRF
jgi:hypothetical protein